MEWLTFYNLLTIELNEKREGDSDTEYSSLNNDLAKHYTNESIRELVQNNPRPFYEEERFYFNGETTIFKLPVAYNRVDAYFDETEEQWKAPTDSSCMTADVRALTDKKLIFSEPKQKGDSILLKVAKYPALLVEDADAVDFPEAWMYWLRLYIIAKVDGRKGKLWETKLERLYLDFERKWQMYNPIIKAGSYLRTRGHGFGR